MASASACSAAAVARPSTAGAPTLITRAPSWDPPTRVRLDPGRTLIATRTRSDCQPARRNGAVTHGSPGGTSAPAPTIRFGRVEDIDVAIVGGGQSGLATVRAALNAGVRPVLLEKAAEPVGSWPLYYDSLTLFSPARYAALPGRAMPGDPDRYPHRADMIDYLRGYAADLDADIRTGWCVDDVGRGPDGSFVLTATDGRHLRAGAVVAATGRFGRPRVPELPGRDRFTGQVLHTAGYRGPAPFAGQRVVVVGGGNSAVQIAAELAEVARVTVATRRPIRWAPQRPLGRDMHWWLGRSRLDIAPIGPLLGARSTPVIDDGRYRAALRSGNPAVRALPFRLAADRLRWADGSSERVDTIILATGFVPDLGYLAGIARPGADERPLQRRGISTTVPGLGYVGLELQRSISSATLRGVGRDAVYVIDRLTRSAGTCRAVGQAARRQHLRSER